LWLFLEPFREVSNPLIYLRYLRTVLRHKWFVFLECKKEHILLRGIMHDMSKFRPSEFIVYARYFEGGKRTLSTRYDLAFAWLLHQRRNRHHWQWWVLYQDDGTIEAMSMDEASRVEMICDWRGAARCYGGASAEEWYWLNKDNMLLNSETREYVERRLGLWRATGNWE